MANIAFPKLSISNHLKCKQQLANNNTQLRGIVALMLIFIAMFAYANYHASDIDGLHRHNFLQYTYPKWMLFFLVTTYSAIGWYIIIRANGFWFRVTIFILFSFGSILYGGSFSTIINNSALFLIAQSIDPDKKSSNARILVFLILGFFAASIIKIAQEYYAKGYTPEQLELGIYFIANRLTTQAHLIWFSVERYSNETLIGVGFNEFLLDFFNPTHTLTIDYGLGRLMFHANNSFGQRMVEEGIGMSAGFPSIVLASSGLISTVIACIGAGAAFFLMFSFLVNCAKNYGFPMFFLTFYFFNQFTNIIYNGDFGFVNFKTLLYLVIFLAIYYIGKKYLYGRVWPSIHF